MKNSHSKLNPFLRWPGGKRWAASEIVQIAKSRPYNRYIEPFLGGGAVFFALQPANALLSDVNADLIKTYNAIKQRPRLVKNILSQMPITKEYYNELRRIVSGDKFKIASRFLYLNRMAFSGMYRVNRDGYFNVPYGGDRNLDLLTEHDTLSLASNALKTARIVCADFEETIDVAGPGDLVYCDPTYTVSHNENGFVRYNEKIFCWEDQIRLASVCQKAKKRGARLIISNAAHIEVAKLYHPCKPLILERMTTVSRVIRSRKQISEYLFVLQ